MVFSFNVWFLCAFTVAGSRLILKFELCNSEVLLRKIADADVAQHSMGWRCALADMNKLGIVLMREWLLFFAH